MNIPSTPESSVNAVILYIFMAGSYRSALYGLNTCLLIYLHLKVLKTHNFHADVFDIAALQKGNEPCDQLRNNSLCFELICSLQLSNQLSPLV